MERPRSSSPRASSCLGEYEGLKARLAAALPQDGVAYAKESLKPEGGIVITGGNATIYVTDMSKAVSFYVDVLGLKLVNRFGDYWAEIQAGSSLLIGLHPKSEKGPLPGTSGAISVGLTIDQSIDDVVTRLQAEGVRFRGPIVQDDEGGIALAFFGDPDGNDLYLCQVLRSS